MWISMAMVEDMLHRNSKIKRKLGTGGQAGWPTGGTSQGWLGRALQSIFSTPNEFLTSRGLRDHWVNKKKTKAGIRTKPIRAAGGSRPDPRKHDKKAQKKIKTCEPGRYGALGVNKT